MPLSNIDHLVYAVPDLELGIAEIEQLIGVKPVIGGQHMGRGTWNALIALGPDCYLEIIAPDPAQPDPTHPRWMGVDYVKKPGLVRWAGKSANLEMTQKLAKDHGVSLGEISAGSRHRSDGSLLQWRLINPTSAPGVDVIPFWVDWQDSVYPTQSLTHECQLLDLSLSHPHPASILGLFKTWNLTVNVTKADSSVITLTLQTPRGIIHLT